jgi:hypothetical protein
MKRIEFLKYLRSQGSDLLREAAPPESASSSRVPDGDNALR